MPVCIVKCQPIHYSSVALQPSGRWAGRLLETGVSVSDGARTFLSAATCFAQTGNKSEPRPHSGEAADRNVRAPLSTYIYPLFPLRNHDSLGPLRLVICV